MDPTGSMRKWEGIIMGFTWFYHITLVNGCELLTALNYRRKFFLGCSPPSETVCIARKSDWMSRFTMLYLPCEE